MMNTKNKIQSLFATGLIGFLLVSCNDYPDVRPKSQIPVNLHFEKESGFADQLTGVYTKICEETMYGREMTFGLIEVLAQNYDLELTNSYEYAAKYQYVEKNTKNCIDAIWANTYNAIANLNLILNNIDDADPAIFSENHRALYKGETLGLRSFLLFDLLRIFSSSYASNPNAPGIPYVTEYAPKITPKSTVGQTIYLMGNPANNARTVNLAVNPAKTTAQANHYAFPTRVVLPADSFSVTFPVSLKRTNDLREKGVRLYIEIVESPDFQLGVAEENHLLIKWSDVLTRPANWNELVEFFGTFSIVKYRFIIETTGVTEFSAQTMSCALLTNYRILCVNALNAYNDAHPGNPLKDENGQYVIF